MNAAIEKALADYAAGAPTPARLHTICLRRCPVGQNPGALVAAVKRRLSTMFI